MDIMLIMVIDTQIFNSAMRLLKPVTDTHRLIVENEM